MSFQTWCMSQQFRRQLALEHLGVLEYFFESDYFIIKVTDRDHGNENSPQVLVPQETIKPAKTPNHSKFQLRLKQPINERNIWRANYTVWLKKGSWLCHKPLGHSTRQLKKQFMFVSQTITQIDKAIHVYVVLIRIKTKLTETERTTATTF